jgi:hypothetical protein
MNLMLTHKANFYLNLTQLKLYKMPAFFPQALEYLKCEFLDPHDCAQIWS